MSGAAFEPGLIVVKSVNNSITLFRRFRFVEVTKPAGVQGGT